MARGCPLSEIHIEDKGVTAYKYTQYGFLGGFRETHELPNKLDN